MPDTHRIAHRLASRENPADTGPVSTKEPQEHVTWFPLTDHGEGYAVIVTAKGDMTDAEAAEMAELAWLLSGDPWGPRAPQEEEKASAAG